MESFTIYRGQRFYDDEKPLNKKTPVFHFPRPIDDPAPFIVVVQGPRNIGKSLLIKSLVKKFTETETTTRTLSVSSTLCCTTISFTTASGKDIRLQFVECPDDIHGMVDAAKYADVVILMVDASYGFEMETFEFRNLLQVHGFPEVIGVLTHLDKVSLDERSEVKKRLEDHFCTEIYEGAELSSLCGLEDGLYKMAELDDLGEMLSDSEFLPLSWRAGHPHVLVDRFEYATPERNLSLYGYLRGCDIKKGSKVHIAGAGDFSLAGVTRSCDPLKVDSFGDFDPVPVGGKQSHCKTGTYLRLDVLDVPPEIVENLNSHHPILVGGIFLEEEKSGFMMVKLRRHSWHKNLLMSGVPITVSAGWRRYQTNAIYAMGYINGPHRLLKYTPEHEGCVAVIWGPLAPPKTRIVAVLNKFYCLRNKETIRIMAKGVVLDNRDAQIVLKVNKIGTLVHTDMKTAHIKFEPGFEFDRFVGAPIQTNSGILGKIDEAAEGGIVKCTFENRIRMGDTFLFPVLATLVLPSLFKQLILLFKLHLEPVYANAAAACIPTVANDAAVYMATKATSAIAVYNAYVNATISADAVEDELAVSYKEVAPRPQMLEERRGVVIHEGWCSFATLPNPLELEQKVRKRKRSTADGVHSLDPLPDNVGRLVPNMMGPPKPSLLFKPSRPKVDPPPEQWRPRPGPLMPVLEPHPLAPYIHDLIGPQISEESGPPMPRGLRLMLGLPVKELNDEADEEEQTSSSERKRPPPPAYL